MLNGRLLLCCNYYHQLLSNTKMKFTSFAAILMLFASAVVAIPAVANVKVCHAVLPSFQ